MKNQIMKKKTSAREHKVTQVLALQFFLKIFFGVDDFPPFF
jgi:hypothetical protein